MNQILDYYTKDIESNTWRDTCVRLPLNFAGKDPFLTFPRIMTASFLAQITHILSLSLSRIFFALITINIVVKNKLSQA